LIATASSGHEQARNIGVPGLICVHCKLIGWFAFRREALVMIKFPKIPKGAMAALAAALMVSSAAA
jgi:hypothetical protein